MSWTEEQVQELKKRWGNGDSASDIAKILGGGLTRNAVIGKAHRLKLSSSPSIMKSKSVTATKLGRQSLASVKKSTKKRAMLRPLPSVQMPISRSKVMPAQQEEAKSFDVKTHVGISVGKATERQCRWPMGDPRSADFKFCGCNCVEGLPYCADHARMAYQGMSKKAR